MSTSQQNKDQEPSVPATQETLTASMDSPTHPNPTTEDSSKFSTCGTAGSSSTSTFNSPSGSDSNNNITSPSIQPRPNDQAAAKTPQLSPAPTTTKWTEYSNKHGILQDSNGKGEIRSSVRPIVESETKTSPSSSSASTPKPKPEASKVNNPRPISHSDAISASGRLKPKVFLAKTNSASASASTSFPPNTKRVTERDAYKKGREDAFNQMKPLFQKLQDRLDKLERNDGNKNSSPSSATAKRKGKGKGKETEIPSSSYQSDGTRLPVSSSSTSRQQAFTRPSVESALRPRHSAAGQRQQRPQRVPAHCDSHGHNHSAHVPQSSGSHFAGPRPSFTKHQTSQKAHLYWRSTNGDNSSPSPRHVPRQNSSIVPNSFGIHPHADLFFRPQNHTAHTCPHGNPITTTVGFTDSSACPINGLDGATPSIFLNPNALRTLTSDDVQDIIIDACREINLESRDLPASGINAIGIFVIVAENEVDEILAMMEEIMQHPDGLKRLTCIIPDGNLPGHILDRFPPSFSNTAPRSPSSHARKDVNLPNLHARAWFDQPHGSSIQVGPTGFRTTVDNKLVYLTLLVPFPSPTTEPGLLEIKPHKLLLMAFNKYLVDPEDIFSRELNFAQAYREGELSMQDFWNLAGPGHSSEMSEILFEVTTPGGSGSIFYVGSLGGDSENPVFFDEVRIPVEVVREQLEMIASEILGPREQPVAYNLRGGELDGLSEISSDDDDDDSDEAISLRGGDLAIFPSLSPTNDDPIIFNKYHSVSDSDPSSKSSKSHIHHLAKNPTLSYIKQNTRINPIACQLTSSFTSPSTSSSSSSTSPSPTHTPKTHYPHLALAQAYKQGRLSQEEYWNICGPGSTHGQFLRQIPSPTAPTGWDSFLDIAGLGDSDSDDEFGGGAGEGEVLLNQEFVDEALEGLANRALREVGLLGDNWEGEEGGEGSVDGCAISLRGRDSYESVSFENFVSHTSTTTSLPHTNQNPSSSSSLYLQNDLAFSNLNISKFNRPIVYEASTCLQTFEGTETSSTISSVDGDVEQNDDSETSSKSSINNTFLDVPPNSPSLHNCSSNDDELSSESECEFDDSSSTYTTTTNDASTSIHNLNRNHNHNHNPQPIPEIQQLTPPNATAILNLLLELNESPWPFASWPHALLHLGACRRVKCEDKKNIGAIQRFLEVQGGAGSITGSTFGGDGVIDREAALRYIGAGLVEDEGDGEEEEKGI